jgi:hypothetical protein
MFAGERSLDYCNAVILKLADTYPVSLASLWVEKDDTVAGVSIFKAANSDASVRRMTRVDKDGNFTPYYDYYDTAMSKLGPYRPERIVELRRVSDARGDNPDVALNNGHMLHQTTFFVGPVNFYYQVDGKTHCLEANTGDSNYITPFVPHSFTTRAPQPAGMCGVSTKSPAHVTPCSCRAVHWRLHVSHDHLCSFCLYAEGEVEPLAQIIAVTYAGEVRTVMSEFGRMDAKKLDAL